MGKRLVRARADEGHRDHRGAPDAEPAVVFALAHHVELVAGGFLATLLKRDSIEVNSVHGQGVKQLAPGLRVEARAPDGLVEAFSVIGAPGFTLAVQWHPEWQAHLNPVSTQIFEAFGAACRLYRDR
jgi:putative glutamine amidotransferase